MRPLVIVGCGGFGREVFSIVEALNADKLRWSIEGFVDDDPTIAAKEAVDALDSQILGDLTTLSTHRATIDAIIAVGVPEARAAIRRRLRTASLNYPVLIHPDATVGRRVDIGEGVVIAPGARLSTAIRLGHHVQIDQNATVGHDTRIGSCTRLNPQACVSGSVSLGESVLVGAGATILQGLSIGSGATIGAAACVVNDVPPRAVVKGVPAR